MDLKQDKVFKNEHSKDLVAKGSLLNDFPYTESLEFDQRYEGIPPGSITSGAKQASEPNASFQEITVRVGESLQQAAEILREQGGGIMKLVAGTHKPTTDVPIYSSITIEGENASNTIIDFGSTSGKFVLTGTDIYTAGVIGATAGNVAMGVGTVWTSDMVGHHLFMDNRWYQIVAFISSTQIVLDSAYADGASYSGTYRIVDVIRDVEFRELTIKNSTGTGITGTDVRDLVFEDINLITNGGGIALTNFMSVELNRILAVGSTGVGVSFTNGSFLNARQWANVGNGGHGVALSSIKTSSIVFSASNANGNDGYNCTSVTGTYFTIEAASNQGQGVEFVSGCNNNTFISGLLQLNAGDGLKLTATCDENVIGTAVTIKLNSLYGINIAAATCDSNLIIGNVFSLNTSGAVNDSGTSTLIRSNQGVADAP